MSRTNPARHNSDPNGDSRTPVAEAFDRGCFHPDADDPTDWAAEEQFMWAITSPSTVGIRGVRRDRL